MANEYTVEGCNPYTVEAKNNSEHDSEFVIAEPSFTQSIIQDLVNKKLELISKIVSFDKIKDRECENNVDLSNQHYDDITAALTQASRKKVDDIDNQIKQLQFLKNAELVIISNIESNISPERTAANYKIRTENSQKKLAHNTQIQAQINKYESDIAYIKQQEIEKQAQIRELNRLAEAKRKEDYCKAIAERQAAAEEKENQKFFTLSEVVRGFDDNITKLLQDNNVPDDMVIDLLKGYNRRSYFITNSCNKDDYKKITEMCPDIKNYPLVSLCNPNGIIIFSIIKENFISTFFKYIDIKNKTGKLLCTDIDKEVNYSTLFSFLSHRTMIENYLMLDNFLFSKDSVLTYMPEANREQAQAAVGLKTSLKIIRKKLGTPNHIVLTGYALIYDAYKHVNEPKITNTIYMVTYNNYNKTFTFTGIDQNDKNNNSKVMTENEFIDRVKNLNNTIK